MDKERQYETRILSSGANFNIEVCTLKLLGEGSLRRVMVNELMTKLRFIHIFVLIVASYSSYSSCSSVSQNVSTTSVDSVIGEVVLSSQELQTESAMVAFSTKAALTTGGSSLVWTRGTR